MKNPDSPDYSQEKNNTPGKPTTERRQLAAIMFTDISGYTLLMAEDEKRALDVVTKNRDIQQRIVDKHQGTMLKEMGDGTLSSFPSTINAVHCAIEIQNQLKDTPDYKLRIGIHLGDVVFTSTDVYGDGVNIAARLEPTAIPGGISISGQVYDTLTSRRDIEAIYLGEKSLKNVKRPIKIYAITNSGLPTPEVFADSNDTNVSTSPEPADDKKFKNPARYLLAASVMMLVGTIAFLQFNSRNESILPPLTPLSDDTEDLALDIQNPTADETSVVNELITTPAIPDITTDTALASTPENAFAPSAESVGLSSSSLISQSVTDVTVEEVTAITDTDSAEAEITSLASTDLDPVAVIEEQSTESIIEDLTSIAILPLANLSADPDNAFFAAGVHEEILDQLAKIADIRVLSRRSVLRFGNTTEGISEIGKELGVATIMEGSVRFAGNRVRITCQLIRVSDESHLWSETYERELEDIFAIQSDVALQVARAMQANLLPEEIVNIEHVPTVNLEAYSLLLRARYRAEEANYSLTADDDSWLELAITDLERAIILDPNFADAYGSLAMAQSFKSFAGILTARNPELEVQAEANARKAIELDPASSYPYSVLAILAALNRDWVRFDGFAEQALASRFLPTATYTNLALMYTVQRRGAEAITLINTAVRIDPGSEEIRQREMLIKAISRDYEGVLDAAENYRAIGGEDDIYHLYRAAAYNFLQREQESINELEQVSTNIENPDIGFLPYYGYLLCQNGQPERVQEVAIGMEFVSAVMLNLGCNLGLGNYDPIFELFEPLMTTGIVIPDMGEMSDGLRQQPRYAALERYINLPPSN